MTLGKKIIRAIVTVILSLAVICILLYFVKSTQKIDLCSVSINEANGDVAISYYGKTAKIIVFDCNGNEKYTKTVDDAGGGVNKMIWEGDGNLCIRLGRRQVNMKLDSSGKVIDTPTDVEYPSVWQEEWDKNGSSYVKQVGENTYCYDYAAWYEYFGNPVDKIYVNNGQAEKCIWQDME